MIKRSEILRATFRAVYSTALLLLLFLGVSLLLKFTFNSLFDSESKNGWLKIGLDLTSVLVLLFVFKIPKKLKTSLKLPDSKSLYLFLYSALIVLVSFAFLHTQYHWDLKYFRMDLIPILASLTFLLLNVIKEELIFRYLFLEYLARKKINSFISLIFSSFLFSFIHLFNSNVNFLALVNTFFGGLILGFIYLEKRNIWHPIAFHLGWNFTQHLIFANFSEIDAVTQPLLFHISDQKGKPVTNFSIEESLVCLLILLLFISYYIWKRFRKTIIQAEVT